MGMNPKLRWKQALMELFFFVQSLYYFFQRCDFCVPFLSGPSPPPPLIHSNECRNDEERDKNTRYRRKGRRKQS